MREVREGGRKGGVSKGGKLFLAVSLYMYLLKEGLR